MSKLFHKALCKVRTMLGTGRELPALPICEKNPDVISEKMAELLSSPQPCMIARFGSTELGCVVNYLGVRDAKHNPISYLLGKSEAWWWNEGAINNLSDASGFFPKGRPDLVEKFCELFLSDVKYLDLLGSWHQNEAYLEDRLSGVDKVFLPYMEPYWSSEPWTKALKGKKVLVVHPFAELIEYQYKNNREKLFSNPDVFPEYSLQTIKAVQSLGGDGGSFKTWFDALEWMEKEIDSKDYDVCIIGCGAYGFHLAAHVKRAGKKAIHLGGATQLLFGIKGNRWEDPMYGVAEWGLPDGYYKNMFNDAWVKAGQQFKPKNAQQVENACYW